MKAKGGARHHFKPRADPITYKGITCPNCKRKGMNIVAETRKQCGTILRRRKCVKCEIVFKTVEKVIE